MPATHIFHPRQRTTSMATIQVAASFSRRFFVNSVRIKSMLFLDWLNPCCRVLLQKLTRRMKPGRAHTVLGLEICATHFLCLACCCSGVFFTTCGLNDAWSKLGSQGSTLCPTIAFQSLLWCELDFYWRQEHEAPPTGLQQWSVKFEFEMECQIQDICCRMRKES